jgi:hypothetical protein
LVDRETWVLTAGVAFFLLTASRSALVTTIRFLSNGYQRLFNRVVKRSGREADFSPPSDAEAKNDGAMPSLPYTP